MDRRTGTWILLLTLFLTTLLTGCGGGGGGSSSSTSTTTPVVEGPYGVISGTILDPVNGAPVAGAIVSLNSGDTEANPSPSQVKRSIARAPLAMTLTDSAGIYRFEKVPEGSYNLTVDKDGRFGAQISAVVRQGTVTEVPQVTLTPVVTIKGVVRVDATLFGGEDLPQVLVWILGTSLGAVPEPLPVTTPGTRDYSFSISGVPARSTGYTLRCYAENHIAQNQVFTVSPAQIPADFIINLTTVVLVGDPNSDAANQLPVAQITASATSIAAGASVTLDGSASSDPDGDPLVYHWSQTAGPAVAVTGSTASLTLTLSQPGNYTFMLVVTDDHRNVSVPALVSVTATTPANLPPSAVAMISVNGGTGTASATAALSDIITLSSAGSNDPEGASLSYRWAQTGGPAVSFTGSSIPGESNLATDSFTVSVYGNYRFALTVSDGTYDSRPAYVGLTISIAGTVANQPPMAVATADTQETSVGNLVTLDGSASSDPDSQPSALTYTWQQVAGPAISLASPTVANPAFTPTAAGLYLFQLTVFDGIATSLPTLVSVQILVPPVVVNQPPTAVAAVGDLAGTPVSSVLAGDKIYLDATASIDPDGTNLTYLWTQIAGPLVVVNNATTVTADAVLSQPGAYSFRLQVSDGQDEAFAFALVEAQPVSPPANLRPLAVATANATAVSPGATVTLDGATSSDPESASLTFNWSQVVGPIAAPTAPNLTTTTVTLPANGTYTYELVVNDGVQDSLPSYVTIIAGTAANQPPVVVADITDGTNPLTVIVPGSTVTLDASASSDPDAGPSPLSFSWEQLAGPTVVLTNPLTATASATPTLAGTYTFMVTVSDGDAERSMARQVTVNSRPVARIDAPVDAIVNSGVSFTGSNSSDADGDLLTYSWTQIGGAPEVITFGGGGTVVNESFTPGDVGTYIIQLVVNDGLVNSLPVQFEIRVRAPGINAGLVTVNQNTPTVNDTVTGAPAALPGGGFTIRAFADSSLSQVLQRPGPVVVEAISAADGSFTLDLGDNNPAILHDTFYIAAVTPLSHGEVLQLVNDVTPPAAPAVNRAASDWAIIDGNTTGFTVVGTSEPGASVSLTVRSISPTVVAGPEIVIVNPATGLFSVTIDASTLPDGDVLVEGQITDTYGNASAPFPFFTTTKDTLLPTVTIARPLDATTAKAAPAFEYTLSENMKSLVAVFTDTGDSTQHTFSTEATAYTTVGFHGWQSIALDIPLVDGRNYNLSVTVTDLAGNAGNTVMANITCDTTPPSGALVTAPGNNGWINPTQPLVSYDLSSVLEIPDFGRVRITQDGGAADPHTPMTHELQPGDLLKTSHSVLLSLPFPLQTGTTYTIEYIFEDAAGNLHVPLLRTGVQPVDTIPGATLTVLKPTAGGKISASPQVSYVLSATVANLHVRMQRVSSTGPLAPEFIIPGGFVTAGTHMDVSLGAMGLLNNERYNMEIREQRPNGDLVDLVTVPDLVVDTGAPYLESARAVQSVWSEWNAGDQLIFTFNEVMNKDSLADMPLISARMLDVSGNAYTWFSAPDCRAEWDTEGRVLTITLNRPDPTVGRIYTNGAGDSANAYFNPDPLVTDLAGNADNTSPDVELLTGGDKTPAVISLGGPLDGQTIGADPTVSFSLNEKLSAGNLNIITLTPTDPLPVRNWAFDAATLAKGGHNFTLSSIGVPPLLDGVQYRFNLDATDMGGNYTEVSMGQVTCDAIPPSPPDVTNLLVRNFAGTVIQTAESVMGGNGDYLRVYQDTGGGWVEVATAVYPGPYNTNSDIVRISGFAPITGGATVGFSFVDAAGNESAIIADGIMPNPPTDPNDNDSLSMVLGTTNYGFVAATNLSGFNLEVNMSFNQNPVNLFGIGTTDGSGAFTSNTNSVSLAQVSAGNTIWYLYRDLTGGHYSEWPTNNDGLIARLSGLSVVNTGGAISPNVDTGDTITFSFDDGASAIEVTVPNAITSSNCSFSGSSAPVAGEYAWSSFSNDINLAAVAPTAASASFSALFCDIPQDLTGLNTQHVMTLTSGTILSPSTVNALYIDLNPRGTSVFLSPGGHIVLPSNKALPITPNGTINGLSVTGF